MTRRVLRDHLAAALVVLLVMPALGLVLFHLSRAALGGWNFWNDYVPGSGLGPGLGSGLGLGLAAGRAFNGFAMLLGLSVLGSWLALPFGQLLLWALRGFGLSAWWAGPGVGAFLGAVAALIVLDPAILADAMLLLLLVAVGGVLGFAYVATLAALRNRRSAP